MRKYFKDPVSYNVCFHLTCCFINAISLTWKFTPGENWPGSQTFPSEPIAQ